MTKFRMTGYAGRSKLLPWIVSQPEMLLIDIRFLPRSRNMIWSQTNLIHQLGEYSISSRRPGRYIHIPEFGNRNFHTRDLAQIQLHNPAKGIERLRLLTITVPEALLLCVCNEPECCHRSHVQAVMAQHGLICEELVCSEPGLATQRRLFI